MQRISRSRSEEARRVERARIVLALGAKERIAEIAKRQQRSLPLIYQVLHRFNALGLAALDDAPTTSGFELWTLDTRPAGTLRP